MKKVVFVFALLFFVSVSVQAADYYIDFENGIDSNAGTKEEPWKYVPGMVGWSGEYSIKAGDNFVLKGGVTWVIALPEGVYSCWNIFTSGNAEDGYISYTVDKTWYKGSIWTRPRVRPNSPIKKEVVGKIIYAQNVSYIKINGIEFRDTGQPGVTHGNRTINAINIDHWDIVNCKFQPYDSYILVFGQGMKDVNIKNNEFSDAIGYIEMSYSEPGIKNLDISYNTFGSITSMNVDGRHADGVQLHDVANTGDLINFRLHHNRFTGNWGVSQPNSSFNSCFYINGKNQVVSGPVLVYNNLVDINFENADPTFKLNAIFVSEYASPTKFYNNTIRHDGTPGIYGSVFRIRSIEGSTVEVVGNIIDNCVASKTFWYINFAKDIISNNNIIYNYQSPCVGYRGTGCKTISQWQNDYGLDANSYITDPNLDSNSVPMPPSDAIDHAPAQNEFADDYRGVSRPRGAAWDIGALEYDSGIAKIAPSINSIEPKDAEEGSGSFILKVRGNNFNKNELSLLWNGNATPITWVSDTEIIAVIATADIEKRGLYAVAVTNNSGTSNTMYFNVILRTPQVLHFKDIKK